MAVFDQVGICTMALDRIGIGQPITSLLDETDEARVCDRWYDKCRDKVLALGFWPFQRRRVTLGLVEEDPNDTWGFSYRYPVDCIALLGIDNNLRVDHPRIEFELGADGTGRLIFTDQEDAVAIYGHSYDDPGEWPDLFADAVAWLLASEIAIPLRVSDSLAARAVGGFQEAKASAMARAQSEGHLNRPVSSYVTTRGGYADPRRAARLEN